MLTSTHWVIIPLSNARKTPKTLEPLYSDPRLPQPSKKQCVSSLCYIEMASQLSYNLPLYICDFCVKESPNRKPLSTISRQRNLSPICTSRSNCNTHLYILNLLCVCNLRKSLDSLLQKAVVHYLKAKVA